MSKTKKKSTKKKDVKKNENIKVEEEKIVSEKKVSKKKEHHVIVNFFLLVTLLVSFYYFIGFIITDKDINSLINSFILVLFTLLYVIFCINVKSKSKKLVFFSSLLLIGFYIFNILNNNNIVNIKNNKMISFTGMSIDEVVDWSIKNNIRLEQDYEYSDMVEENYVISQSVKEGENLKDVDLLKIAVSEGPSNEKDVVIPDMTAWSREQVISFVEDNFLSNVDIEFKNSKNKENTVIDQSTKGTIKRKDDIKITFSNGEELDYQFIELKDLTGMSKFRARFYLAENHIKCEFDEDYSNKYKRGYVMRQSIDAGSELKVNEKTITLTISKGKKIEVIDFTNKSIKDVTKWIIKNHLKVVFEDRYDENIGKNIVIGSDKKKGDIVSTGETIKIYVSLGKLKMKKFKDLSSFIEWANKNNIKYIEEQEFSDKVPVGEIIRFSVKAGDVIKSGDVITVVISSGKDIIMPNVVGLTKSKAIAKLEDNKIKYNIVYSNSDEVESGKVISQSIRSGSKISENTTVTINVSSGKKTEKRVDSYPAKPHNDGNNSNGSSGSGNNSSNNDTPSTPTCNTCSFRPAQIYSILEQYNDCNSAANALRSSLQSKCSGLKVNITCQKSDGFDPADFISGFDGGDVSSCDTISIVLAS